jgi:intein/homing endonuclease
LDPNSPVDQWFRTFSQGGWKGEVRHIKTIAEVEFQKWDLVHINLCGVTAPIIPKVKELLKGSSTILMINEDYPCENFQEGFSRPRDFYEAIKAADFIFCQTPWDANFMNFLIKTHMPDRKADAAFVSHPVDVALKKYKIDYEERIDNIATCYHRYRNELLIPSMISWGLKYPTILFGFVGGNIPVGLFHYTAAMMPWQKYFYQLAHCSLAFDYVSLYHCTTPGSLILGDNKPIALYNIGSKSLGLSGFNVVTRKFKRFYDGPLIKIKGRGLLPLRVTPEHPILIAEVSRGHSNATREILRLVWKKAKDDLRVNSLPHLCREEYLKRARDPKTGRFVSLYKEDNTQECLVIPKLPVIQKSEIELPPYSNKRSVKLPLNEETAWLLGLYVAEGSGGQQVKYSFGKQEEELADMVLELWSKYLPYTISKLYTETTIQVYFGSPRLSRFFEESFGKGARNKKIPSWILLAKPEILRSFLLGYCNGDGHRYCNSDDHRKRNGWGGGTASEVLALQLQLAWAKLGHFCSLFRYLQKDSWIDGRKIKGDVFFNWYVNPKGRKKAVQDSEVLVVPLASKTLEYYRGYVYNLETSDQTYLISNVIVHNCQGRYEMETACLSIPTVCTNHIYMGLKLFPMVCHDPTDFEGLRSSLQKLMDNEEFYHSVADYAYEHVEEFNHENSKKRLLEELEKRGFHVG